MFNEAKIKSTMQGADIYGAPFWQKLITCISTLIFVRHQSTFCATQNFFNQYNIYLYTK